MAIFGWALGGRIRDPRTDPPTLLGQGIARAMPKIGQSRKRGLNRLLERIGMKIDSLIGMKNVLPYGLKACYACLMLNVYRDNRKEGKIPEVCDSNWRKLDKESFKCALNALSDLAMVRPLTKKDFRDAMRLVKDAKD